MTASARVHIASVSREKVMAELAELAVLLREARHFLPGKLRFACLEFEPHHGALGEQDQEPALLAYVTRAELQLSDNAYALLTALRALKADIEAIDVHHGAMVAGSTPDGKGGG